jgi:P27 family predicted phage terminase small subunit
MPNMRKPTALKMIEGTNRKARENPNEPMLESSIPNMPSWLPPKAKTCWRELSELLLGMRVITKADRKCLELLCDAYSEYRDCRKFVTSNGYTYKTVTQSGDELHRPYPQVNMAQNAWKRVLDGLKEFGLSPSSKSKVSAIDGLLVDPLEEFLRGGKPRP